MMGQPPQAMMAPGPVPQQLLRVHGEPQLPLSPPQQAAAALDDAALADIYGRVDRNHDGRITRAELIKTVRSDAGVRAVLGLPQHIGEAQRAELEAGFPGMDVDDSRGIDFPEFAAFVSSKRGEQPPGLQPEPQPAPEPEPKPSAMASRR